MSFKEKTGKKVVLVGTCTRDELVRDWGYPAKGAAHGEKDLLYRIQSTDATNDQPKSDKGGNFGRIARTGLSFSRFSIRTRRTSRSSGR